MIKCLTFYRILYNFEHCPNTYFSYCSIVMHLYIFLVSTLSRVSFFATIYDLHVIHNSYFISDFGVGNNIIDPYVTLAMPFNFILSSNFSFVILKYPVFIMAIPLDFSYVCHTMYIVT